ncbi:MAG: MOSC domain-containing protein [Bacteroidia bacterium]|nr:MOSC domain-containing protein [Bacteroidia bacterium]
MPKILSLVVYPIKGMRGIEINQAKLRPKGFQFDRRWMLVDQNGKFISQRSHPILTQFNIRFDSEQLLVSFGNELLKVEVEEMGNNQIPVSVFDDQMLASEAHPSYSNWFSQMLNESVQLVRHSSATERIKNFATYVNPEHTPQETPVSFADGYPYLIVGTASMDLLNSRMSDPLPLDRFRANIIVETFEPHEEDHWQHINIGDQKLLVIKPCARCQVPNIDQKTGISGNEPNKTLATYRKRENKIYFGMNAISLTNGLLTIGQEVYPVE